jgi:hypothetical protein
MMKIAKRSIYKDRKSDQMPDALPFAARLPCWRVARNCAVSLNAPQRTREDDSCNKTSQMGAAGSRRKARTQCIMAMKAGRS